MAKVARAARVASRQRTEALTASKTIQTAETGELYLIDAKSLTITLPDPQEGAYFTFIVGSKHTLHTANTLVTIKTGGGSDKLFPGSKFEFWSDGTNWYVHAAIFVGGDALIAFA